MALFAHPLSMAFSLFAAASMGVVALGYAQKALRKRSLENRRKTYSGKCHCGKVTFECLGPTHLVVWQCSCTFCNMLKNYHFIIPESDFTLGPSSDEFLSLYQFNNRIAKHTFCKVCGISPFYRPRSNPDGYAITMACVDQDQIESFEYRYFDGLNWESFHGQSGITKFSSNLK